MAIEKQLYERQLELIFRMFLENKTNEQIASELKISVRTVQNYKQRIDKRYGDFQRNKTGNTIFMECQLFKNRMLSLYKSLEAIVMSDTSSGTDKAKCAEIAADIAINVLKMESEGIKAVKDALIAEKEATRRRSLSPSAISNSSNNTDSNMMYYDESEEIC